jgi:muconolactone delta-isomerase
MLYLVISTPRPERPSSVLADRQRYWEWLRPLQQAGTVRSVHARIGRGAVVMFDVDSHAALHRLVTQWCDIIPAQFEIHPLLEADAAQDFLATGTQSPQ